MNHVPEHLLQSSKWNLQARWQQSRAETGLQLHSKETSSWSQVQLEGQKCHAVARKLRLIYIQLTQNSTAAANPPRFALQEAGVLPAQRQLDQNADILLLSHPRPPVA